MSAWGERAIDSLGMQSIRIAFILHGFIPIAPLLHFFLFLFSDFTAYYHHRYYEIAKLFLIILLDSTELLKKNCFQSNVSSTDIWILDLYATVSK